MRKIVSESADLGWPTPLNINIQNLLSPIPSFSIVLNQNCRVEVIHGGGSKLRCVLPPLWVPPGLVTSKNTSEQFQKHQHAKFVCQVKFAVLAPSETLFGKQRATTDSWTEISGNNYRQTYTFQKYKVKNTCACANEVVQRIICWPRVLPATCL